MSSRVSRGALCRDTCCPSTTFLCFLVASQRPFIGFQQSPPLWDVHLLAAKYLHKTRRGPQTVMTPKCLKRKTSHPLQRETQASKLSVARASGKGNLASTNCATYKIPKTSPRSLTKCINWIIYQSGLLVTPLSSML